MATFVDINVFLGTGTYEGLGEAKNPHRDVLKTVSAVYLSFLGRVFDANFIVSPLLISCWCVGIYRSFVGVVSVLCGCNNWDKQLFHDCIVTSKW